MHVLGCLAGGSNEGIGTIVLPLVTQGLCWAQLPLPVGWPTAALLPQAMAEPLAVLSAEDCQRRAAAQRPASLEYYAFYSSFLGGVVLDPAGIWGGKEEDSVDGYLTPLGNRPPPW
jgi:hypothetical protein